MNIDYIHEPTDLQCGQAVLAMLLGTTAEYICQYLLSLETPRCWHWSLYADGTFYDPEHGILSDFPQSDRKFYWEIFPETVLSERTSDNNLEETICGR